MNHILWGVDRYSLSIMSHAISLKQNPLRYIFSISFAVFCRWSLLAPQATCLGDLQRPSSGDSWLDLRSRAPGGTGSRQSRSGATAIGCGTGRSSWWREDCMTKTYFFFFNGTRVELERKEWHVQGDICPWIYGYTLSPWNLWTCLKFFQSNSELMVDLCRFWYVGSISKVEMLLSITAGGHIQWLMCQPLTTPGSGWDGVCLLAMVLFSWMVSHCCVLLGFLQDKNLFLGITSCVGCQLWYDQGSGPICPPYLHDFLTTLYIVAGLSLYSLRAPPKKVTKTCWSSEIIQIVGVSFILYIYI